MESLLLNRQVSIYRRIPEVYLNSISFTHLCKLEHFKRSVFKPPRNQSQDTLV